MNQQTIDTTSHRHQEKELYLTPELVPQLPLPDITANWMDGSGDCPSQNACDHANGNAAFNR